MAEPVLALGDEAIATLKITSMLSAATNAAAIVGALADKTPKSAEEAMLYNAAIGLLQCQLASVLEQFAKDRQK